MKRVCTDDSAFQDRSPDLDLYKSVYDTRKRCLERDEHNEHNNIIFLNAIFKFS